MSRVRILSAHGHPGVPEMVKGILASSFEVIGTVVNGKYLVEWARRCKPDWGSADAGTEAVRNRFTRSHRKIAAEVAQVQAKLASGHPPLAARTVFRDVANAFPVVAFWTLVVIVGVACCMFLSSH
jgi:hypothetical protein